MNIQEDIDDILEENGPLEAIENPSKELIEKYTGRLPELLLALWREHGIGSWAGGLFRLCNPDDFEGLLSQVFHADKDFSHSDCHVYGYSAFGSLYVWSERHWVTQVDLLNGRVACPVLLDPAKAKNADIHMSTSLSVNPDSLDAYDDDGKKLFARAVKKLGRPDAGQAFGFFPALAMGGAPRLENLRIVPALEHFLFLAQLQPFKLVDYLVRPPQIVREIG